MSEGHKHHALFPKNIQNANPDTKELRRNYGLIPLISEESHIALHIEVGIVPALDRHTAKRVRRDFEPIEGDYVGSMEELMSSIERASKHPKAGIIEIENAAIVIHAIDLQRPYIREGLIRTSGTSMFDYTQPELFEVDDIIDIDLR